MTTENGKEGYLEIFLEEAQEQVAFLQKGILALERDSADLSHLSDLMRHAHTLKGTAGLLGFEGIGAVCHRLEDLLDRLSSGRQEVDQQTIDLLLKGTDAVSRLLAAANRGEGQPFDLDRFLEAFDRGEVPDGAMEKVEEEQGLGDTIRTGVTAIDGLVNRLGELIISRTRFEEQLSRLKRLVDTAGDGELALQLRAFHLGLEGDVLHLSSLIQDLHGDAMALRMLPLRTITEGLDRLVRDLARELGKVVEFTVSGDQIEMDRVLLETLKPALVHILRNSVDHGIESVKDRLIAGKLPKGVVTVSACHEGRGVRITVRDDGHGIDPHLVKGAAILKGVISKEEAELLTAEESLYLVTAPGFSTRDFVTDVSGRGVGMDVVKQNIERVKGELIIRSDVGAFTEIELRLPLTLAVIDVMLARCGTEVVALPLSAVHASLRVRPGDIVTAGGKEVVMLPEGAIPLVPLPALLGFEGRRGLIDADHLAALVIRFRNQFLVCSVDEVVGSFEIVVKGVGEQLKGAAAITGATILGDGNPALILSVPFLFSRVEGARTDFRQAFEEGLAARVRGKVLVVDDSITTRAMEKGILTAHGYQTDVAISGEEALDKVRTEQFDLVVTDIQMPGIDGFELTRRLRTMERYQDVPVVIVSSLARDEDKRRAMEVGAQAYIVKGNFDQGSLLSAVEALIG